VIEHLRYDRLWPIIIAPASIQENWVREITKWFTGKPGRPRRMEVYRVDEPSMKHTEASERVERKIRRKAAREKVEARDERASPVDFDASELEALEELALNEKRLKTVRKWKDKKKFGPLIISYQLLRTIVGGFWARVAAAPEARAQEELAKLILEVPNLVVMDEGHLNRNPDTQTFQVLGRLKTQRRLMLTGNARMILLETLQKRKMFREAQALIFLFGSARFRKQRVLEGPEDRRLYLLYDGLIVVIVLQKRLRAWNFVQT
jgi:SNF2 family DNA or RNA helicase